MIRKSMPSATTRWVRTGFPSRQTRNAFARRSCSNKKIERDDASKKSHHALGGPVREKKVAHVVTVRSNAGRGRAISRLDRQRSCLDALPRARRLDHRAH